VRVGARLQRCCALATKALPTSHRERQHLLEDLLVCAGPRAWCLPLVPHCCRYCFTRSVFLFRADLPSAGLGKGRRESTPSFRTSVSVRGGSQASVPSSSKLPYASLPAFSFVCTQTPTLWTSAQTSGPTTMLYHDPRYAGARCVSTELPEGREGHAVIWSSLAVAKERRLSPTECPYRQRLSVALVSARLDDPILYLACGEGCSDARFPLAESHIGPMLHPLSAQVAGATPTPAFFNRTHCCCDRAPAARPIVTRSRR